jgi:hypothetical protein
MKSPDFGSHLDTTLESGEPIQRGAADESNTRRRILQPIVLGRDHRSGDREKAGMGRRRSADGEHQVDAGVG